MNSVLSPQGILQYANLPTTKVPASSYTPPNISNTTTTQPSVINQTTTDAALSTTPHSSDVRKVGGTTKVDGGLLNSKLKSFTIIEKLNSLPKDKQLLLIGAGVVSIAILSITITYTIMKHRSSKK